MVLTFVVVLTVPVAVVYIVCCSCRVCAVCCAVGVDCITCVGFVDFGIECTRYCVAVFTTVALVGGAWMRCLYLSC